MTETSRRLPTSTLDLIRVPALITLGVTLVRLTGELLNWSPTWFNHTMGPSIVAIVWLAPVFGVYFAIRISLVAEGPSAMWRPLMFAALGVATLFGGNALPRLLHLEFGFHSRLLYAWTVSALSALVTLVGWPALFRTILAYALTARVPVAVIMFFAFWRNWGTHYDAWPSDLPAGMSLVPKYLWLGFFPQLVFWVGFTVLAGMLFGGLVGSAMRVVRRAPQTTS